MHKARTAKASTRARKSVDVKQVLEDVRRLRASSMAVYRRVIRELDKQQRVA